jgi:multiple antibiotic resistance protein
MQSAEPGAFLGVGAIVTLFLVTLGPVKILGPFAQQTRDADESVVRQVALRAFMLSLVTVVLGGYLGVALLRNWHISVPALELAGGFIFLIVGMRIVLEQYNPVHAAPPALPSSPIAAALHLTFPTIVTPYGIAAVMVLVANSRSAERTTTILLVLAGVMVLNLVFMLLARAIMRGMTIMVLRILGAVLGVLQVALAVELILLSLRQLGVLNA